MVKTLVSTYRATPFVKWVGGKGQLLDQLLPFVPPKFNRYFEPFVGGGALFFELSPDISYLNDLNYTLMAAYENLKNRPDEIIRRLSDLENAYIEKTQGEREAFFYEMRQRYNSQPTASVEQTSLLIFLNKTCFNGMYRANSKGAFNTPHGRYANPNICDAENILAVSDALKNAVFSSAPFYEAVSAAKKGDFIYLDPPYHPLNTTSSFTSYNENNFRESDQLRLRDTFIELDRKGCFVMLSNSHTEFILDLYKDFKLITVWANRAINCKATGRGKIKEAVIINY